MAGNAHYALKIAGVAIVGGLILDNWSGANALGSTGFSGAGNLVSALRTGKSTATKPAA